MASGYCDAQAHGQPLCSVQCHECITDDELAALRAENAKLREAVTKVTTYLSAYAEYEEIRTPSESTFHWIHRTLSAALPTPDSPTP